MKAYVIVQETVKDEEMFAAYRNGVVATLEEFGGRFVVRGGNSPWSKASGRIPGWW
jgi:uncharacterized protein (DUF1330 family)